MPKAVVLVSSDTSYLERKLSILNYRTYPIDEFNHKNIHMLRDLDFTNNFINMVKSKHSHPYLIYGSGLEDKKTIEAVFEKISLSSSTSSKNLGSNWFEHWFGYFYEYQNGWSYHSEFGWIYPSVQDDGSIWFWSENFSWLWVEESTRSKGLYWKADATSWIYFPDIHPSNQIFFHYKNQEWIKQTTSISNG